jgi:hypothetical protein
MDGGCQLQAANRTIRAVGRTETGNVNRGTLRTNAAQKKQLDGIEKNNRHVSGINVGFSNLSSALLRYIYYQTPLCVYPALPLSLPQSPKSHLRTNAGPSVQVQRPNGMQRLLHGHQGSCGSLDR